MFGYPSTAVYCCTKYVSTRSLYVQIPHAHPLACFGNSSNPLIQNDGPTPPRGVYPNNLKGGRLLCGRVFFRIFVVKGGVYSRLSSFSLKIAPRVAYYVRLVFSTTTVARHFGLSA